MLKKTVWCLAASGLALLSVIGLARAQEKFPDRPIEFILPSPPGGGNDITMRTLAELAEPILGQKFIFTYKAGSGGSIGTTAISQAKPDGYTIGGVWHSPLTALPHVQQLSYSIDDFDGVLQVSAGDYVLCVAPDFPAGNGAEFIAELKANPGKYTYGHDGVGNAVQLATERTLRALDVQIKGVPFNGSVETARFFLGGHVSIYGGSVPPIIPHVEAGTAKCLLVNSASSNPRLPAAANLSDLGIADKETALWHAIIVPKGLPADRLEVLEKAFREAAESEKFQEKLKQFGERAPLRAGTELTEFWTAESDAMKKMIEDLGIKSN